MGNPSAPEKLVGCYDLRRAGDRCLMSSNRFYNRRPEEKKGKARVSWWKDKLVMHHLRLDRQIFNCHQSLIDVTWAAQD